MPERRLRIVLLVSLIGALSLGAVSEGPGSGSDGSLAGGESVPVPEAIAGSGATGPVIVIPIDTEITDVTTRLVKRGFDRARVEGAKAVVLDMDTPGGLVSSAMDISHAIKESPIRTVAWVHPEAISGGALVSLACNEIVTVRGGKIGDCAPIMISPEGGLQTLGKTERAKISSYILAEFRGSARANGYPESLCEAMVVLGPAIYEIRNTDTQEVRYVYADELPNYGLSSPRSDWVEDSSGNGEGGSSDALRTVTIPTATEAESDAAAGAWVKVKLVLKKDNLLTMLAEDAIEYGFAKQYVENETEMAQYLGAREKDFIRMETSWSEDLVVLLTSTTIRALLTIVLLMALYSEMNTPGLGIAGAVALGAALILFGAPYLVGMADVFDMVLIALGIALLLVELLIIPGFGVTGFLGIGLLIAGLVLTAVPAEPGSPIIPQLPQTWSAIRVSFVSTILSFVVALVGCALLARFFGVVPGLNRMLLTHEQTPLNVGVAETMKVADLGDRIVAGSTGTVTMGLHPIGKARINGQLVDVVSAGDWIEVGASVKVTEVAGARIVVEEIHT